VRGCACPRGTGKEEEARQEANNATHGRDRLDGHSLNYRKMTVHARLPAGVTVMQLNTSRLSHAPIGQTSSRAENVTDLS